MKKPLKRTTEEINDVAKMVAENHEDEELRNTFLDLIIQLYVVSPL